MKKILGYLLVFVLMIPFVVKADMGAPMVRQYEVLVVKEEGISYYNYKNGKLVEVGRWEKNQTLSIDYEITEDGIKYLSATTGNDEDGYDSYYVKASDVVTKEKEVKVTDSGVNKLDKVVKVKATEDVDVRKGPGTAYEKIGTIKKDTVGTYRYYIDGSTFVYYESDDLSGWVDSTDGAVLFKNGNYIVYKLVKMSCGTIPFGTLLTNVYTTNIWTGKGLIEYNGCSEMIRVFRSDNLSSISYKYLYTFDTDVKVYADTDTTKKELATIPKNTKVTVYGQFPEGMNDKYSYYVEYGDIKGWVIDIAYDKAEFVESLGEVEYPEDSSQPTEVKTEEKDKEDSKEEDKKEDKMDTTTIILICVIVGLAIALGATITIILVNKKK